MVNSLAAGLKRILDPSFSHNLERLGCFAGTFSLSLRQIRSTRLWFTLHPSFLSIAVILRYP
jgi:hypothetical protein